MIKRQDARNARMRIRILIVRILAFLASWRFYLRFPDTFGSPGM